MGKVQKNYLYNVVYQILTFILPLITAPYVSRVLGANGIGVFSYTSSIAGYFVLIGMLGMSNLGSRSIAEVCNDVDKRSQKFWELYFLQIVSFLIVSISYIIYVVFFVNDYQMIASIQFLYILGGFLDISWFFFGMEMFKLTVTRNIIVKIFTVIFVFVFVKSDQDIWKYTIIIAGGSFLSQSYLWSMINRYIIRRKINFKNCMAAVKPLLIYFIPVVAYSVYKVMDKIMLGQLSTMVEVGYYENALKIINVPMGVISALGAVMLPHMTSLVTAGNSEVVIQKYIRLSVKFVTLLASAICFGLIGVAGNFAPMYYGSEFSQSGPLIAMLSITCFFVAWANVCRTQYLIPYHKDSIYVISTVVGALLNIIGNSILIPQIASKGAVISTIVAEFSVMFIQVFLLRKQLYIYKYILSSISYIINGFIMMTIVIWINEKLGNGWVTLIIQIAVGISIFLILTGISMYYQNDELFTIVLKKRKKR